MITLPWHLGTWMVFGSALPVTLPVKAEQPGWGPDGSIRLANSIPMYVHAWPAATWLTLATLVAGVLAGAVAAYRRWWAPLALAGAGAADLAVMAVTGAGAAAYYAGPAVVGLGLAAVLVAGRARWLLPALGLLLATAAVSTVVWGPSWKAGFAPLRQNWATTAEYRRIAADLPTNGVVLSDGEIGALAFYCGDRCTVVDPWLSDPGRSDAFVQRWRADHPGLAMNWTHYRPPAPLPVRYRLVFASAPGPGPSWPVTTADHSRGWATLNPA